LPGNKIAHVDGFLLATLFSVNMLPFNLPLITILIFFALSESEFNM